MPVTQDIVEAWLRPKAVMQRHLARGKSEPFAFSLLVAFLLLAFISLWPFLSRQTVLQPDVPMVQRLVGAGLALLASIPFWYLLAAISRMVGMALGGGGSFYTARLALFAALLGATPGMLLQGLVAGMIGPGVQMNLVGVLVGIGFIWIWLSMLLVAERPNAV